MSEAEFMCQQFPSPPPEAWYEAHERPPLLDYLGPWKGRLVLGIGSATGWLEWQLKREGAHVLATDIFSTACHPGVPFLGTSKECTPFADASYDAVATSNTLHHGDLEATTREAYRVLKPGGLLVSLEEPLREPGVSEAAMLRRDCAKELAAGILERRPGLEEYLAALRGWSEVQVFVAGTTNLLSVGGYACGVGIVAYK